MKMLGLPRWLVLGITGFLVIMFITIWFAASKEIKYVNERVAEIENCEIIGDSLDRGHSVWHLRTIYKCPDGMIRIR